MAQPVTILTSDVTNAYDNFILNEMLHMETFNLRRGHHSFVINWETDATNDYPEMIEKFKELLDSWRLHQKLHEPVHFGFTFDDGSTGNLTYGPRVV